MPLTRRASEEPKMPICPLVKPCSSPVRASKGPTPPEDSCKRMTDKKSAAKDKMSRIAQPSAGSCGVASGI